MQEGLEVVERILEQVARGRHEERIGGSRAVDPVLAATELSGSALLAADAAKELPVQLTDQTLAQRQVRQASHAVLQSTHVVEDLALVLGFDAELRFCREHLAQRRLGSFDPRARDRLAAKIGLDQEVRVGQAHADPGKFAQGAIRLREEVDDTCAQHDLAREPLGRKGPIGGVTLADANGAPDLRRLIKVRVYDKTYRIFLVKQLALDKASCRRRLPDERQSRSSKKMTPAIGLSLNRSVGRKPSEA